MTDPKTRALSLIDELDSDRPALASSLRLAITQVPTTHIWVPIAECGELADGKWFARTSLVECMLTRADGRWVTQFRVTHVLSPHLGPIPEAP